MKYILSAVILFALFSVTYGQNCPDVFLSESGDVQVIVQGPETGECFQFYANNKLITPDRTGKLTFSIKSADYRINDSLVLVRGRLIMADGYEFKKNMSLPEGYKSHLFEVKKKKKGKYSLKRKMSGMVPTEATLAQREADKKEFFDEHDRKVAAAKEKREAESAADEIERAKKRQAMKERVREGEGAQLSEYTDDTQGLKGADHKLIEGADHQVIKGADHKLIEGADHQLIEGADHELIEGADHKPVGGIQGREEQLIQGKKDPFGSQDDSFGKSAFDDDDDDDDDFFAEPEAKILNPNGETIPLNMRLLYDGKPVGGVKLTLEINNIVLGSGTTDKAGNLVITTSKPIDMNRAFRLSGAKGAYTWMFGGIQLLDFPPKTTKVDMNTIIMIVSKEMGSSPDALRKSWRFVSEK